MQKQPRPQMLQQNIEVSNFPLNLSEKQVLFGCKHMSAESENIGWFLKTDSLMDTLTKYHFSIITSNKLHHASKKQAKYMYLTL